MAIMTITCHPVCPVLAERYQAARTAWAISAEQRSGAAALGMSEREWCDRFIARNFGPLGWLSTRPDDTAPDMDDFDAAYEMAEAVIRVVHIDGENHNPSLFAKPTAEANPTAQRVADALRAINLKSDHTGHAEPSPLPPPWRRYRVRETLEAMQVHAPSSVHTATGAIDGRPGDYLCRNAIGTQWFWDREAFEEHYEPADPE
ncbi:MAG: hypothetical protein NTZ05_01900 [Chloroflexi bacterium]|nr:hypothetical protein [Chloroflexota bacterium]